MLFSLVVPVYNVAQYLPKCVESLLAQDFEDYEILLVDDGSTDGICPVLCDQYAAQYPQRIHAIHQKNCGLGGARNTGLEAASGEYLFFVDSDDYIEKDSLSYLSKQISKNPADMYFFPFQYVKGNLLSPSKPYNLPLHVPLTLQAYPRLLMETPSATVRIWRRTLFTETGIRFPGRVWFEDLCTTPKCLHQAASIVVLEKPLYYYLLREGSIMHNPNLRRNLEIIDALETLRAYFEAEGCFAEYEETLCLLAVDSCIFTAQRVLMADPDADFLPRFIDYVQKYYPDYRQNPLLPTLGRKKLLVLRLLERKRYWLLRRLFTLSHRLQGR